METASQALPHLQELVLLSLTVLLLISTVLVAQSAQPSDHPVSLALKIKNASRTTAVNRASLKPAL